MLLPREKKILERVKDGHLTAEIAFEFNITEEQVEKIRNKALEKLLRIQYP